MRRQMLPEKPSASFVKTLVTLALLSACGTVAADSFSYSKVKPGKLAGKLIVQWIEPDRFIFEPDPKTPLTFTRHNGQSITPGRMITDGGSVPRPIWVLRNYSPWGFAPAFIVHDWLFEVKQCKRTGHELFNLENSADVMAEVMKTMIESKKIDAGPLTVAAMHEAVLSKPAREAWERGPCSPAPNGLFPMKPILQYEISF
jgi:Protein of unknown function (DUF1353)